ncbi:MAG: VWA domain-containing protein [Phycisphaerae bacterium]
MDGRINQGKDGGAAPARGRAVTTITPWGVSLLFHAGIAIAAATVAMTVTHAGPREFSATALGAILAPQPAGRITMAQAFQAGAAPRASMGGGSNEEAVAPGHGAPPAGDSPNLIGPVPSAGENAADFGQLAAVNQAAAIGQATSLGPAAFRAAPRSSLFGAGGNARHVVYVLDRSGSMIDTFEEVRRAVLLSIGRLDGDQDFHVILFAEGRAIENPPGRLVPPTEANKLQVADFLAAARPGSQSHALVALNRAFDVLDEASSAGAGAGGSKLIYLLTDGVLPDGPAILAAIRDRDKNKQVHICTYYCGNDAAGQSLLKEIARSTGGLFRQIDVPSAVGRTETPRD